MAIENEGSADKKIWIRIARFWYSKVVDDYPATGRLYHHLALLARHNVIRQYSDFTKSLSTEAPFPATRESIMEVIFYPSYQPKCQLAEAAFIEAHRHLFTETNTERFGAVCNLFLNLLDSYIDKLQRGFKKQGSYIALSHCAAMLGFGSRENILMRAMSGENVCVKSRFLETEWLINSTLSVVLRRVNDPNILPFVHVTLIFMYKMSQYARAILVLDLEFNWGLLAALLNYTKSKTPYWVYEDSFPTPEGNRRPLPEDLDMRGMLWTKNHFPETWFENFIGRDFVMEEERMQEKPSMFYVRKERILWLGRLISKSSFSLEYRDGFWFDSRKS
jgi:hypothetical protein